MSDKRPRSGNTNYNNQGSNYRDYQKYINGGVQENKAYNYSAYNKSSKGFFDNSFFNGVKHWFLVINSDVIKRPMGIVSVFFIPLIIIYCEIFIRVFNGIAFQYPIYPGLFAVSFGLLISGITLFIKPKARRIVNIVICALISLLFTVESLSRHVFETYFALNAMARETGEVLTGFGDVLLLTIWQGLYQIILFFLPTVLYAIITNKVYRRRRFKRVFAAEVILLSFIIHGFALMCVSIGGYYDQYRSQFDLTNSSDIFGLVTGVRLSIKYGSSGGNEDVGFEGINLSAAPTPTEAITLPTETTDGTILEGVEGLTDTEPPIEPTPTPEPTLKPQNAIGIDFYALAQNETDENYKAVNQYVASLTPSSTNEYTGLFKGKNLILICAEAFSDAIISPELTPTLARLQRNGFYFTDAYQPTWGGSTLTGEYSLLMGLVPTNGVDTVPDVTNNLNCMTIGAQLNKLGYYNAMYHNGSYIYYDRDKTHLSFGYDKWIATGNGLEDLAGTKYPTDEAMMLSTIDDMIAHQPFSVYYLTVEGHAPYTSSTTSKVKEHIHTLNSMYGNSYNQITKNYICFQLQLEDALASLVKRLEEAGVADDTVICMVADHYPNGLNKDGDNLTDLYKTKVNYPWLRDRNSIIIWSGCLENENVDMVKQITSPTYSLDILPTLLNLFGIDYDSRLLVGRDVFSTEEALVLWNNGSFVTERGWYDGSKKQWFPKGEAQIDDNDYIKEIQQKVKNKRSFSIKVKELDYYRYLFEKQTISPYKAVE